MFLALVLLYSVAQQEVRWPCSTGLIRMDKPKLPVLNSIYRFWNITKDIHSKKHTHPLCICLWCFWGPDEEWSWHMPAEPSMPPTGKTNNEFLKGSTGRRGVPLPNSPSAQFLPWTPQSWTFYSFCLYNAGASVTSDSESGAVVTTRGLVLSLKLWGFGTQDTEQLTERERPCRFVTFMLPCGEPFWSIWDYFFYFKCEYSSHAENVIVLPLNDGRFLLLNTDRSSKTMMYF